MNLLLLQDIERLYTINDDIQTVLAFLERPDFIEQSTIVDGKEQYE